MKESIMKEPGTTRTKKIEIELPEDFHKFLKKVCDVWEVSFNDYVIRSLVLHLESDVETNLGFFLGEKTNTGEISLCRKDVESLAWPEAAEAQEAQV